MPNALSRSAGSGGPNPALDATYVRQQPASPAADVVVTDALPLTTTFGCIRWSEATRRRFIVQNQSTAVIEIGYGDTGSNPATTVTATIQPGQEFVETNGSNLKAVWARTQSGTATVFCEATLAGV